jgi:hypothetical protein
MNITRIISAGAFLLLSSPEYRLEYDFFNKQ